MGEATFDRGGVVIPFPMDRIRSANFETEGDGVTCLDCSHVYVGAKGLFCGYFAEPIVYEDIAEDCSEFDAL